MSDRFWMLILGGPVLVFIVAAAVFRETNSMMTVLKVVGMGLGTVAGLAGFGTGSFLGGRSGAVGAPPSRGADGRVRSVFDAHNHPPPQPKNRHVPRPTNHHGPRPR